MRKWIFIFIFFVVQQVTAFPYPYYDNGCTITSLPEIVINTEYSNRYSLIVNPKYTNIINPYNALALEIAFGASEFRLGATWAHLIGLHQRFKATTEYLSQNQTFHFIPGDATQWTEQGSLALLYQYIFGDCFFNAINISAYHSHARDENLPLLQFTTTTETILTDRRWIVGSNTNGVLAGISLLPWYFAKLDVQLAYDNIHYNSRNASNSSGLGEIITVDQWLGNRIRLQLSAAHRILFDEYTAGINWIVYAKNNNILELSLVGKYLDGDQIPEPQEARVGIIISYRWDASCPHIPAPCSLCDQNIQALHTWTMQPVVRMPRTFVLKDEKVS